MSLCPSVCHFVVIKNAADKARHSKCPVQFTEKVALFDDFDDCLPHSFSFFPFLPLTLLFSLSLALLLAISLPTALTYCCYRLSAFRTVKMPRHGATTFAPNSKAQRQSERHLFGLSRSLTRPITILHRKALSFELEH